MATGRFTLYSGKKLMQGKEVSVSSSFILLCGYLAVWLLQETDCGKRPPSKKFSDPLNF